MRTMKKAASPIWIACRRVCKGHTYYHPTQEGREKLLAQRMDEIRKIREEKHGSNTLIISASTHPMLQKQYRW